MVSIIIVNYNSLDLIFKCVTSIYAQTTLEFEIILVSNSNEDQIQVDTLINSFPDIKYYESGGNVGFAKANNIGAKHASGKYLFFLNPDTLLINNVIELLVDKLNSTPNIGLIAPAIYNQEGNQVDSIIGHIKPISLLSLAFPFINPLIQPNSRFDFYKLEYPANVDVVHGSAMLIRTDLFNEIGGMNEDFFLYCEERELCLNVALKKHDVFFLPEAKIEHVGGGTTEKLLLDLEIEKHRSKKIFIQKYYLSLNLLNRFSGIIGYTFRVILSYVTLNKIKQQQFGALLKWYLFSYK